MKETHTFKFRGVSLPAEVVQKFVSKEITRSQLGVLILVESLVAGPGEGCWASNNYIATSLGMTREHTIVCIRDLLKMGLLFKIDRDGKRHLETAWSNLRTPPQPQASASRKNPTSERVSSKKILTPPSKKILTHNSTVKMNKREGSPPSGDSPPPVPIPATRTVPPPRSAAQAQPAPLPCYNWEKELRRILREHHVRISRWGKEGGARAFQKLRRWAGDDRRIDSLLAALDKKFDTPGLPTIISANQFCKPELFVWLEDRLLKRPADAAKKTTRTGHTHGDIEYIREHYGEYPKGPVLDKMPRNPPAWFYVRTAKGIDKYDGRSQMDGPIQQNRLEECSW